jgi:hypothetical protein
MTALPKHIGSSRRRACVCASAITLLATLGCWDEIRYNPTDQPTKAPSEPVVLHGEVSRGELTPPAPSAHELFAGEQAGETASNSAAIAPTPKVETKTSGEEDPLWSALDSAAETPAVAEPAPPAELESENQPPPEEPVDERIALAAWQLASKWSLAVGIYGKGYAADRYGDSWEQADAAAKLLEVELSPLPPAVAAADRLTTATSMLLDNEGPELAVEVGRRHSAQDRALCDLAIKTHALLLIYTPDGGEVKSQIAAIRRSADASTLPEDLWAPLVELLDSRAEYQDVKRAVFQLHAQAADYLSRQGTR